MQRYIKKNILRNTLVIAVLCLLLQNNMNAQSTVGTDFWVTFLPNIDATSTVTLVATGNNRGTGVVKNPQTGWEKTFNINIGTATYITIPNSQAYDYQTSDSIINTALHITTTVPISLYAGNFNYASFDATNILPTPSLGSIYVVQTYSKFAKMSIIATKDSTTINIRLPNDSLLNRTDSSFSILLNSGECYQMSRTDLSGTTISANDNKKIAVFAGNSFITIPDNNGAYDHTFEQMIPTPYWGNRFIITNSMLRANDRVRVTALGNNCEVKKNGEILTTLNANETYEFEITSSNPVAYLETSLPACVFLYLTGWTYGGEYGDPSMVIINPIEQKINDILFTTFTTEFIDKHFVNIITKTDNVTNIQFDGYGITPHFNIIEAKPDYSYARLKITIGTHYLIDTSSNEDNGFIAHVYGLGEAESYSYSAGFTTVEIPPILFINGLNSLDYPDGLKICCNEDTNITFNLSTSYEPSDVVWDFGDGTTKNGFPISHQYDEFGIYNVLCSIYRTENEIISLDTTLSFSISINKTYDTTIFATICQSEAYNDNGFYENKTGIYVDSLQTNEGCDSIIRLNLTVNPEYNDSIFAKIRQGEFYNKYGFNEYETGIYSKHLVTHLGCDSSIHLILNVDYEPKLFVPNCITPKDYTNNKLFILHEKTLIIDDVYIHNRFGELIFKSENNRDFWNGKYKEEYCPQGTYTYIIYYHTEGEKEYKTKIGTVVLLY